MESSLTMEVALEPGRPPPELWLHRSEGVSFLTACWRLETYLSETERPGDKRTGRVGGLVHYHILRQNDLVVGTSYKLWDQDG